MYRYLKSPFSVGIVRRGSVRGTYEIDMNVQYTNGGTLGYASKSGRFVRFVIRLWSSVLIAGTIVGTGRTSREHSIART